MCGKFTQMMSWSELVELADLQRSAPGGGIETVTPMRFATVITRDAEGRRTAMHMRWGFVPAGTKDPLAVKPHIHARAETLDEKPAFRDAWRPDQGATTGG